MAAKYTYWEYSTAKKHKSRWGGSQWMTDRYLGDIRIGKATNLTQKEVLAWAYMYAKTVPIYIDKAYNDEDGETHSKSFGVVKAVKRKTGRAVIFYKVDDGFTEYTADVTPQGTLKNKRY